MDDQVGGVLLTSCVVVTGLRAGDACKIVPVGFGISRELLLRGYGQEGRVVVKIVG